LFPAGRKEREGRRVGGRKREEEEGLSGGSGEVPDTTYNRKKSGTASENMPIPLDKYVPYVPRFFLLPSLFTSCSSSNLVPRSPQESQGNSRRPSSP